MNASPAPVPPTLPALRARAGLDDHPVSSCPSPRRAAPLRAALACAAVLLAAGWAAPALAADTPEPAPRAAADPLGTARAHVQASRWPAALAELRRVNLQDNADWNNLMGYALRKQATPDLNGAQRHYDAALRLNPTHRGALEYAGELALMKNDLPTAEARLATLQQACPSGCEELDDLKKAIARFRSTGKP